MEPKFFVSPRLGVAYPVTVNAGVHFAYGHFVQFPAVRDIFTNADYSVLARLQAGTSNYGRVMGNPDIEPEKSVQYEFGYKQALSEAGLPFDPALMVYGDYTRASGQAAAEQLLRLPAPPTAIFALNDRMAIGAIRAIQAAGRRVPEDMAVVGFDDIPSAADFNPALTTVRQPSKEVGQVAAQILLKLIAGEPIAEKEIILPTQLIIRQST